MEISIITPAFNPDEFILKTFESLENQSFKKFEWIIVDDNSDEKNKKYYQEIKDKASFEVVIITNPINVRQAKSKNIGFSASKGKYIKFLDADDLIDEYHLENQYKMILKGVTPNTAIFSPTYNFYESIDSENITINESYKNVETTNFQQLKRFLVSPFFHHCSCLFYKDDLLKIACFDETLITDEDGDLLLRLMLNGVLFLPCEGSYYYYRHHSFSRVSTNDSDEKWHDRMKVCNKVEELLKLKEFHLQEQLAQRLDDLGLKVHGQSKELSKMFFDKAESVYPGYEIVGNKFQNMTRSIFGVSIMLEIKKIFKK